jgi:hypothetical protein
MRQTIPASFRSRESTEAYGVGIKRPFFVHFSPLSLVNKNAVSCKIYQPRNTFKKMM